MPNTNEPIDPVIAAAREICAVKSEQDECYKEAQWYRSGHNDTDKEMIFAVETIRKLIAKAGL